MIDQIILNQLYESGRKFSDLSFVVIDTPEPLFDFFFMKFHNKDTEVQNQSNLRFWRFGTFLSYFNISIYLASIKGEENNLYKSLNSLSHHKTYYEIDQKLLGWNEDAPLGYKDLVDFVRRNQENVGIEYQAALGLWFMYNISGPPESVDESNLGVLLGSYLMTSVLMYNMVQHRKQY